MSRRHLACAFIFVALLSAPARSETREEAALPEANAELHTAPSATTLDAEEEEQGFWNGATLFPVLLCGGVATMVTEVAAAWAVPQVHLFLGRGGLDSGPTLLLMAAVLVSIPFFVALSEWLIARWLLPDRSAPLLWMLGGAYAGGLVGAAFLAAGIAVVVSTAGTGPLGGVVPSEGGALALLSSLAAAALMVVAAPALTQLVAASFLGDSGRGVPGDDEAPAASSVSSDAGIASQTRTTPEPASSFAQPVMAY